MPFKQALHWHCEVFLSSKHQLLELKICMFLEIILRVGR